MLKSKMACREGSFPVMKEDQAAGVIAGATVASGEKCPAVATPAQHGVSI